MTYYMLSIEDWPDFWDFGMPDSAWYDLGQNADLDTLIEILDPVWDLLIHHTQPPFLTPIWLD